MKRNYTLLLLLLLVLFLFSSVSILAQTPEKMSYQLVLRDASNTLLTNQQVGIQISILQTTITGSAVYTEIQTATTNINGLVSLEIGTGDSSDDFSAIDWSAGPYFIKTATDVSGGSNYSIIGTSQLMSVPFALYAKTSGSSTPGPQGEQGLKGDEGNVGDQGDKGGTGDKGDVGDQGETGTDGTNGTNGEKGDTGDQGEQGIQGVPGADGSTGSYVDLTTDQTIGGTKTLSKDLNVNGVTIGKGAGTGNGNIAVGGSSLAVNTHGSENVAIGRDALTKNTAGYSNVALGSMTLTSNIGGHSNTALGYQTLYHNTGSQNVAIGAVAGFSNTTGGNNVSIGSYAQKLNNIGAYNIAIGVAASENNVSSQGNVVIGHVAMRYATTSGNTALGYKSGFKITSGANNTFLGYLADASSVDVNYSMAIGNRAIVNASNKVQIGNASITAVQLGTGANVTLETGLVKITGGTPGVGKVLTSDADGLASWADAATGTDNQTAAEVPSTLTGNIEATNVDAAIAELEAEKAPLASPTFTGSIITPALQVTGGSPEAGKVLTSDADGLASWEEAPGGQSSGTTTGDMQYWNGTAWVVVAATPNEGAALQMISGVPTWVGGAPPATVGDLRAGGVVFWVDPTDNTHGLVCALSNYQSIVEWGCTNLDLPSVPNVAYNNGNPLGLGAEIGDGESNTNSILADCSSAPAALAARSFGSEWFLPSINELKEMYVNKALLEAVSGFDAFSNYYWSSTEIESNKVWLQYFNTGMQNSNYKPNDYNMRAVRAF
jgi:hypothetical protein